MKACVCALVLLLVQADAAFAQELVVRIGHVAPLSGPWARYGKDSENGARLAIDDLNQQHVKIGGKQVKFELVPEDDAADPKQAAVAATKLCDQRVNGVVGHLNSGTSIPASEVYYKCGLPEITPFATNPKLTQQGFGNVFSVVANANYSTTALAQYAARTLKLRRIAVIDDRTAYGQGVTEVFKKAAGARDMEIVSDQFTNDKATDFTGILNAIKSRNPDGIFYGGLDAQAGPMVRQLESLGLTNLTFMGGEGVCTDQLPELAGGAKLLSKVFCARPALSVPNLPDGEQWKKRYDARYPSDFQSVSPYSYDATMVLADAMKRAGSTDPKAYLPLLYKTNYKGVTSQIQFNRSGEATAAPVAIIGFPNGRRVELEGTSGGGGCPGSSCGCADGTCSSACCPRH